MTRLIIVGLLMLNISQLANGDDPIDQELIEDLCDQLGHSNYNKREQAMARLLEIGEPAIPALRKATDSDNLEIRWRSQQILVKLGALVDPDVLAQVKRWLAVAVDELKPLPERLAAENQVLALGPTGLSALFQILVEQDYRLRRHVTEIAAQFGDRQMIPLLLKALGDEDEFIVAGAARQLRRLTQQPLKSYQRDEWLAWWEANKKTWVPPKPDKVTPPPDEPEIIERD
jgi:HEAT repeat protein